MNRCDHEECTQLCSMKSHEDINLGIKFKKDMTPKEFIYMTVRSMIACIYMPIHIAVEDKINPLLIEINRLSTKANELKNSIKVLQSTCCMNDSIQTELIKQHSIIIRKLRDIQKVTEAEHLVIRSLTNRLNRLAEIEFNMPREWKTYVLNHWNQSEIEFYVEGHGESLINCEYHNNEDNHTKCVFKVFPEIKMNIDKLINTEFKTEGSEYSPNEIIQSVPAPKCTQPIRLYHALIKRSKFKYEYIVGNSIPTNGDDIIFMTIINKIKDGYLDYIHMEMHKIVSVEPKRGVTFNNNTFVLRSTAKTP